MSLVDGGSTIPPMEQTLARVVVFIRLLGWAWLVALVVTTSMRDTGADGIILVVTAVVATFGAGLLLVAASRGFLGEVWYAILDGLIAAFLLASGWLADAQDFFSGGYPMSWLFVVAFATTFRWTFISALAYTAWFAFLHWQMDLEMVRTVGSVQFVVIGLVVGWAFDNLRAREALRLKAEADRAEAETELAAEREAATVLKERTEIANELHDSVLQTLKLISSAADDPNEVRYLTRVQERDLRRTINAYRSPHADSFRARLLDARAAVEDRYRVEIEQVIRDDAEMTPRLVVLIDAAREAMANAARHSESATIDLFAEISPEGVQINVRDRGVGFEPDQVGTGGMAHSIINRVEEIGGSVEIKTAPGAGTDVSLHLPAHE